jgi:choline dehydrogenase-like flavoprotein
VGDSAALKKVGIKPVHHLPQVGENLQDHLMLALMCRPGYQGHEALTSKERNVHGLFLGAEQRAELKALKVRCAFSAEIYTR